MIPVCVEFRLPRLFSHWDSESEEFLRHPCSGKHDCPFTIHFTLLHTMLYFTDWGVASEKQWRLWSLSNSLRCFSLGTPCPRNITFSPHTAPNFPTLPSRLTGLTWGPFKFRPARLSRVGRPYPALPFLCLNFSIYNYTLKFTFIILHIMISRGRSSGSAGSYMFFRNGPEYEARWAISQWLVLS